MAAMRKRSLSIDTSVNKYIKPIQGDVVKGWFDSNEESTKTVFVDVRKTLEGGHLPHTEWVPLSQLKTDFQTVLDRISSSAQPSSEGDQSIASSQRIVFVSLTGSEDLHSFVPSGAASGERPSFDMYYLEGGVLGLVNSSLKSSLEAFEESMWVRKNGGFVYGPDVAFDFGTEIDDEPTSEIAAEA